MSPERFEDVLVFGGYLTAALFGATHLIGYIHGMWGPYGDFYIITSICFIVMCLGLALQGGRV